MMSAFHRLLEEQRRQKIRERLVALEAAKKQQAEQADAPKEVAKPEISSSDSTAKRKSGQVDYEELEAKKRRKLQVRDSVYWALFRSACTLESHCRRYFVSVNVLLHANKPVHRLNLCGVVWVIASL